ncbi:MAG: thioredoxin family protein [Kiritimatiellae bacterium]|nr:thioredoxin family protein [Kiritimatiellia bacterium]
MNRIMMAVTVLFAAVCWTNAALSAADFKVTLTGVAVADEGWNGETVTTVPVETHMVVPPGKLALFFLDYEIPKGVKARLFLGPNCTDNPFGTSASGVYSGTGKSSKIIILMPDEYGKPLLLKSVRITGEIEAAEDAPRNNSFFICDAAVNVLFAKEGEKSEAKILEPQPTPKPDPTLGVRPAEANEPAKSSTPTGFTDNLDEALAKAKTEGKLVYACFSGSDWCGWCMKLEREVFSAPAFAEAVKKDFILVFIDTPRNKKVLSAYAKTANPKLVAKYGIRGFPTALILDGDGKKIGETGYREGGPAAYAEHLKSFLSRKGN